MCYPLYDVGIKYAPNDKVVDNIEKLRDEIYYIFGKPNIKQKFMTSVAKIIAKNYQKKVENKKDVNQPKLQRIVYN